MWIAGLIVLGVVLAAGVWLTVTGLRGRVVDDHPVCRKCGFDLVGVYPGSDRCPECGSKLGEQAVRIGQRVRRRVRLAGGALGVVAALLVGVGMIVTMTSGVNWNSHMPTGILIWKARTGTPTAVTGAAQELKNRFNAGTLKKKQIDRMVTAGLNAQSNATRPWDPLLGDLIEAADLQGYLSSENRGTYLEQALTISVRIQQRIRPDKQLAIGLEVAPGRCGTMTKYGIAYAIESIRINGNLRPTDKISGFSEWTLFGFGGRMSGVMRQTVLLTPGVNDIETTWRISLFEPNSRGTGRGKPIHAWTVIVSDQMKLVPEGEPLVDWVNDSDLANECRNLITIELTPSRFPIAGHLFYDLKITSQKQTIALAMDIFFRANDQETRIGALTIAPEQGPFGTYFSQCIDSFASDGWIVLKPNEDALFILNEDALFLLKVDRALGVELSFPVELKAGDDTDD